jgi:hypothetical protein
MLAKGSCLNTSALILRSAPQERVSKDAPDGSGVSSTIRRDGRLRSLLRMRAEDVFNQPLGL